MPTFFYFLEICHETCLFHSPPNYIIPFSFKIWVTRMYPIYTQNFNYFNYFNKKMHADLTPSRKHAYYNNIYISNCAKIFLQCVIYF